MAASDAEQIMSDPALLSEQVKRQMNKPLIHESWEGTYRTEGNERFFEQAYDYMVGVLKQPEGSQALDIGCGICANSVRLARRGYQVTARDYSESIIGPAHENVAAKGLSDRIDIGRDDILNLSFPDAQFDLVLCWGVLMHVPDAERALTQLTRVLKPGGYLVLEELPFRAPEALLMRGYWRALKGKQIQITRTAAGFEHRSEFGGETLFWRHTDPKWLVDQCSSRGCTLVERGCSIFTDLYQYLPGKLLKEAAYGLNRFWLKRVNRAGPSYHNIFIFRKG